MTSRYFSPLLYVYYSGRRFFLSGAKHTEANGRHMPMESPLACLFPGAAGWPPIWQGPHVSLSLASCPALLPYTSPTVLHTQHTQHCYTLDTANTLNTLNTITVHTQHCYTTVLIHLGRSPWCTTIRLTLSACQQCYTLPGALPYD